MPDDPKVQQAAQQTPPVEDHPLRKAPDAPPPGPTLKELLSKASEDELKAALSDRPFTIKVNEEERQVTFSELAKDASKAVGADEKFRQAADGRKAMELLRRAREEGDPEAIVKLMELQGASKEELDTARQFLTQSVQGAQTVANSAAPASNGKGAADEHIPFDKLPPEVQAAYQRQAEQEHQERQAQAKQIVQKAVDDDPVAARIKAEKGEAAFQDAKDFVWNEVWRRVALGEAFTYELIGDVQQSLRPRLARLAGLSSPSTDQPGSQTPTGGYPGVGPAMGPSQSLAISGPPKRVPMTHPDYDKYLREKQLWEARQ